MSSCISEREVGVWDGGWRGGLGIWDFSVLASLTLRREIETVLFQIHSMKKQFSIMVRVLEIDS